MSATLISVRPTWESITADKVGRIGAFKAAPRQEPLFSMSVDFSNCAWMLRRNWQIGQTFMGDYSGQLKLGGGHLSFFTGVGQLEPVLIAYGYEMNKYEGNAFKGQSMYREDAYMYRSYWWRSADPLGMNGFERMAEMVNIACRTKVLKEVLREQLGSLAHPAVVLPIAGIMLVFCGAEYVGGVAFVNAVRVLLGLNQLACDYYFYEPRFRELQKIIFTNNVTERSLFEGARAVAEIIAQILTDVATQLGIKLVAEAAAKVVKSMIAIFQKSEMEWTAAANKDRPRAHIVANSKFGYAREDVLRSADDAHMTQGEMQGYASVANKNQEIIAIREPKPNRMSILKSKVWVEGKPAWMKIKSKFGFHGLLAIPKSQVHGDLKSAGHYDMGHLKGVSAEIDADIAANGRMRPMYEMPRDGRPILDSEGKVIIDYEHTGHKNVLLQGQYLVDLGNGKYLVVDKVKGPYVADLDAITRQQPGTGPQGAGAHLPVGKSKYREDNVSEEDAINREVWRYSNDGSMHRTSQHGGGGASTVHAADGQANKTGYWKPYDKNGVWEQERIVIFLPVLNGRVREVKAFIINTWPEFRDFCKANNLQFPW